MRPTQAAKVISRLIELGKITLTVDGELAQKRSQSEVELAAKRIQNARENGAKGGRPSSKDQRNQRNTKAAGLFSEKLPLTTNHSLGNFGLEEGRYLDRFKDENLFRACEKMDGSDQPAGLQRNWWPSATIERAKESLK